MPKQLSGIPGPVWLILSGDALSALGSGLTLPLLLVYLHNVRGIPTVFAALAIATFTAMGLVGNPLGGWIADRTQPRTALVLGLLTTATGTAALATVEHKWPAFLAIALGGLGAALVWPAQDTLLAAVTPPTRTSAVFAVRHATMNLGLGTGAVLASLFADTASPASFQLLYILDAATYLAFIPVSLLTPGLRQARLVTGAHTTMPSHTGKSSHGIRQVLTDRPFRRLWVIMLLVVTAGAAQFNTAFPAYATDTGHLTAKALASAYAVNSGTVVLLQLPILRITAGRRLNRGLSTMCICWAAAWGLTLIGSQPTNRASATAAFVTALAIFALGETLLATTAAPLVNKLAPAHLRGRYNGVYVLAWTIGTISGSALAGLLIDAQQADALFVGCIVLLLVTAALAWHAERIFPAAANRDLTPLDSDARAIATLTSPPSS
ncbi:MFS transporter [Streptomyces sp. 1222.5]|uniref:MFS transporter n=1 Tax=Streptomyces sp. 1222.5 TaxID=1881026 RepID=UPI003EB6D09A